MRSQRILSKWIRPEKVDFYFIFSIWHCLITLKNIPENLGYLKFNILSRVIFISLIFDVILFILYQFILNSFLSATFLSTFFPSIYPLGGAVNQDSNLDRLMNSNSKTWTFSDSTFSPWNAELLSEFCFFLFSSVMGILN